MTAAAALKTIAIGRRESSNVTTIVYQDFILGVLTNIWHSYYSSFSCVHSPAWLVLRGIYSSDIGSRRIHDDSVDEI